METYSANGGLVFLALVAILVAIGNSKPHSTERVTADLLRCAEPSSAKATAANCAREVASASLTFAVTPAASSCAVMTTSTTSGIDPVFERGQLSYIDSHNWECKVRFGPDLGQRYELEDGRLREAFEMNGSVNPEEDGVLARSDTFTGAIQHYFRRFQAWNEPAASTPR